MPLEKLLSRIDISEEDKNEIRTIISEQQERENKIKESELKFYKMFHASPISMSLTTLPDGIYIDVNSELLRLSERTREEMIGYTALELNIWVNTEQRKFILSKIQESSSIRDIELSLRSKSGRIVHVLWSSEIIEIGGQKCLLSSSQDITERKLAEKKIRESEEKYRNLIDNTDEAIIVAQDGVLKFFNYKVPELTGYSENELLTMEFTALIHPEEREVILENYRKRLDKFSVLSRYTFRVLTKEGNIKWAEMGSNLIEWNGKPAIMSFLTDITERIEIENSLKKSEEKFRKVFATNPDSININRLKDGVYIDINDGFTKITGYTSDEVLGKSSLEINLWVNPEDRARLVKGLRENGKVEGLEAKFRKKNGKIIIGLMSACLIEIGGEDCIISISRDIDDRIKNEEALKESNKQLENTLVRLEETQRQVSQQEKLRSLGQMASGIAHDINNSLTPIMGYIDLLKNNNEILQEHDPTFEKIIKSAKRISNTVGRLRAFYKMKVDNEELTETDLNSTIYHTIELTSHRWKNIAESTGAIIKIETDFQKDLPKTRVDENEIMEALTNLILNACDAMPSGGILRFKTSKLNDNILIQITDTGYGMDQETVKRCLDPFFTTKGEKGTGLGLSMVFGVIDRHKGKIKIESEKNKGTTIELNLPINLVKVDENNNTLIPFKRSLKILTVEDDSDIREMLKQMLTRSSHEVEVASNGQTGLELYKQELKDKRPFEIIITDLGMAGMDGISFSREIKKITPNIPIILLTGWGALIDKDEYPEIDYLLKKPIIQSDLHQAINVLMKNNI